MGAIGLAASQQSKIECELPLPSRSGCGRLVSDLPLLLLANRLRHIEEIVNVHGTCSGMLTGDYT